MNLCTHRRSVIFPIALVWFAACFVACGQDWLEGPAAIVNDDVILSSQVRLYAAGAEKTAREQFQGEELAGKIKEIRARTVDELIDRQLILQEYRKVAMKGNPVPEHVFDERMEAIVRTESGGDREAFVRRLAALGYTLDSFRTELRDSLEVLAMLGPPPKITDNVPDPWTRGDGVLAWTKGDGVLERLRDKSKLPENVQKWLAKLRKKALIKLN